MLEQTERAATTFRLECRRTNDTRRMRVHNKILTTLKGQGHANVNNECREASIARCTLSFQIQHIYEIFRFLLFIE